MTIVRHFVSPSTRTLCKGALCSSLLLALATACSQDSDSPSTTDETVNANPTASTTSTGTGTASQTATMSPGPTSTPPVTATVTTTAPATTTLPTVTTPATSTSTATTTPPTMTPPDDSEGAGGNDDVPADSGAGATGSPDPTDSAPSMGGGGDGPAASSSAAAGSGGMDSEGGEGGGGDTGFAPCPTDGPCVILPLGDSITDGLGVPGGGSYRIELFSLATADGKDITYVGGSMNGPSMVDGMPFPQAHEGHSGWTIQQIDDITPDPALGDSPNIVLLHIGTNDMYQTPAGAPDRLGALIDQILETLPDSLLVVSNIIPFPGGSGPTGTYNAAVPGVVEERANAGKHILFVDQFEGFPESELADGVHPNEAGYARMAGKWYTAIKDYLP